MSRRSGFTLVEVMVVLGVTMMLSTIILVYNNSTRETLRLFTEKARIAQIILRSKSLALSTYAVGGEVPCGYGVQFNRPAGTYALVAYRPRDCRIRGGVDTSADFDVVESSQFTIPSSLEFGGEGDGSDASYVIFIPPDPTVLVADENGELVSRGLGRINLRIRGQETGAIITINAAGQITY